MDGLARWPSTVVLLLVSAALAGCGGGEEKESPAAAPPQPEVKLPEVDVPLPDVGVGAPKLVGRGIETIVQDDAELLHRPDEDVARNMVLLRSLGVDRVRLTAGWSVLAPDPDKREKPAGFDGTDPDAYPRANWRNLDRAVRAAKEAGLEVMIDIAFWAPLWATSGDPGDGRARWNIDPGEYAAFTKAVVRRYSGDFAPEDDDGSAPPPSKDRDLIEDLFGKPGSSSTSSSSSGSGGLEDLPLLGGGGSSGSGGSGPPPAEVPPDRGKLPAVKLWTVWNEPNHTGFIQPQHVRQGGKLVAKGPHIYRRLVEAAYPAIKGIQPEAKVLVGGTSSQGVRNPKKETDGIQPLRFLRELACVDAKLRPIRTGDCAGYKPLPGDGWSHHPYSLLHTPDFQDKKNPDNLPIGNLDRLTTTLDRLAKARRIDPKVANVYLTEFGYETNPPDPIKPFKPAQQADLIGWSEYLAYRNPRVRMWPQFLLKDLGRRSDADVAAGKRAYGDWQSGLLFVDGTPKPSFTTFQLALHADCETVKGKKQVLIWGHVRPARGAQQVQLTTKAAGGFRPAVSAASAKGLPAISGRKVKASAALPFMTAGDGTFIRYAPFRRGAQYRLETKGADGKPVVGLATAPDVCSGISKQPKLKGAGTGEF